MNQIRGFTTTGDEAGGFAHALTDGIPLLHRAHGITLDQACPVGVDAVDNDLNRRAVAVEQFRTEVALQVDNAVNNSLLDEFFRLPHGIDLDRSEIGGELEAGHQLAGLGAVISS